VTFLIPLRIDSYERFLNVQIVISYLTMYFKTNISVIEVDNIKKIPADIIPLVNYKFFKSNESCFFRTRINNKLIKSCNTKIGVLYDCDVILPLSQLINSINKIRQRSHLFALPYDGTFIQIDQYSKYLFMKTMDLDCFDRDWEIYDVDTFNSVGGCFAFNVKEYRKCGLENENIIGWGHDDIERKRRLSILGYDVYRPSGNLYHLFHERKNNSYFFDEEKKFNSYLEYLSICKLNKTQLRDNIKTWSWAN
jgi:predicted glycosyltransferase involved in capsule biosynthesis